MHPNLKGVVVTAGVGGLIGLGAVIGPVLNASATPRPPAPVMAPVIKACVVNAGPRAGQMRNIPAAVTHCAPNEHLLTWNLQGPEGPNCPAGWRQNTLDVLVPHGHKAIKTCTHI